jgi:hypothetical protein
MQTATTIEQSCRLLEVGIKASTADMCYIFTDMEGEQISGWEASDVEADGGEVTTTLKSKDDGSFDYSYVNDSPAWSLSALLGLLPLGYLLECDKCTLIIPNSINGTFFGDGDMFEAVLKALKWCATHGYKPKATEP